MTTLTAKQYAGLRRRCLWRLKRLRELNAPQKLIDNERRILAKFRQWRYYGIYTH